jgi:tetratricopeptide (TPR) repeat protein
MNTGMKSKKTRTYISAFLALVCLFLTAGGQKLWAESEKEIFDRARLALFDRKWDRAIKELDRLTELYPETRYYTQVLFYKGKCYKEKNENKKALDYYNGFLKVSDNESLIEEALAVTIDLHFQLYERGEIGHIDKVIRLLKSKYESVKYFAAFKLSYAKDKRVAAKAVEVLKQIIREDEDKALVDRAKIALMRIDPRYLKDISKTKKPEYSMLVIRAYDKKNKKETFSLSLPIALARLALEAIPEKEKELIKKEGYDLDKILDTVAKSGGQFLRITGEDIVFEIGIK